MKRHLILIPLCMSIGLLPAMPFGADQLPSVEKQVVIRYSVLVDDFGVGQLMNFMDTKRKQGTTDFIILISTQGGTVHAGLTLYNYLKGMPLPVTVTTHNFGSVDSIGGIIYCGGSKRLSVPQARFLIHPIQLAIPGPMQLDEKSVEESLKGLRIDAENIGRVIVANTNKSLSDVQKAMFERTALSPEEAKTWGLVHEIKSGLYEPAAPTYYIEGRPTR